MTSEKGKSLQIDLVDLQIAQLNDMFTTGALKTHANYRSVTSQIIT